MMAKPKFTFRQAQAVYDLIATLQSSDDARIIELGGEHLVKIVRQRACRFREDTDLACYETVASRVLEAGAGADLGVAILVANDIQKGAWHGDTVGFADIAIECVHAAPKTLRAAILRGLDCVADDTTWYEPALHLLPNVSRLTCQMDEVLPQLRGIARGMDQQTRQSISVADHGDSAKQHLDALNTVLLRDDCLFEKDEYWHPSEVVELVAHVRATPGFVACTALLLANALPTNDKMGWFDFRWGNLGPDYNALPARVRQPILAGIRYLYEVDREFLAYAGQKAWDPVNAPEHMIQFGA